jgi:carbamoyltransferase
MRYVGFSEYYHDAALSIINEDGTLEFATQSERYSKKKNDALMFDDLWDLTSNDDKFCFYENVEYKKKYRKDYTGEYGRQFHQDSVTAHSLIPVYDSIVYDEFHEHHQSHCAAAFYTRPWKDTSNTVMVSIDGIGEFQTAVIYDKDFNLIKEWHYPKSVGLVYTTATTQLGLRALEDEYVVMGLSSYGTAPDDMVQWLIDWYDNTPNIAPEIELGERVDAPDSKSAINASLMRKKLSEFLSAYGDKDFAAGIQKFAEYAILGIMKEARKHGSKLCYSGGCAQNVVINSIIHGMFDEVHIAVAPTDAGSSLGTAAMSWARDTGKDQLIWSPYSGYNIDREINVKEVVDHLLEHRVCGLANGRAEFGPRALGNRSLIADVRYDVKDTVNGIKRRQKYRPFAPAILEEYAHEYFEGPMNEYMQYTSIAKHPYSSVTHVDGTARVQVVKKDCESIFRKVIEEYYERTGVPMLLNTSLNIRGRPMVNDEHDAELWEQKYGVKVF